MKKFKLSLYILALLLVSSPSYAAMIVNGDFTNSCSLTGWQTDTDGFAGGFNDFTIDGTHPNCVASINVDYDDTEVYWAANTLFQNLDLSGAVDSTFLLTMDFSVNSELTSNDADFIADYFAIGLFHDGKFHNQNGGEGFLVAPTDINGFADYSFSFELDSTFANLTGWSLDFQVLLGIVGADTDYAGSTLSISNVSLVEQPALVPSVPTPPSLALFSLAIIGLISRRKLAN